MSAEKQGSVDVELSLDQARRATIAIQGLHRNHEQPLDEVLDGVLDSTGFIRTLGGVDVYVAARARVANLTRESMDAAVESRRLQVTPTVRGCIYLVAQRHQPLSLRLADLLSRRRAKREHEKAGIRPGEIEAVASAVLEALKDGPLSTQAIRKQLPDGCIRSLGDAGKKVGISSPLPPALRHLEFAGSIERLLENGRLDTERYLWRAVEGTAPAELAAEPADVHRHMAEIYLNTAGFGDRKGFAAWSGLGQKDAAQALEGIDTFSLSVEGIDSPQIALSEHRDVLETPPSAEAVAFLPFEDNLIAMRQGPAFFVDPEHLNLPVPVWGRGKGNTLGDVRHGSLRPIIAENRLVGFWELDPDADQIVTGVFAKVSNSSKERIEQEAGELGRFLVEELGHGKSFSIDSEKHQRKRCEHIRSLA